MKRLDFLESSNLKMKSQLGVISEGIILQSDELNEVSMTFDKLQDQVQGFLPKTSFGKYLVSVALSCYAANGWYKICFIF